MSKQIKVLTSKQIDQIANILTEVAYDGVYDVDNDLLRVLQNALVVSVEYSESGYFLDAK
jgi:hypothetical protein